MNAYFEPQRQEYIFPIDSQAFKTCHASNICKMQNNELAAAWFAGEKEGSDDIAIWYARTEQGEWLTPQKVAHDKQEPHWNPVLYQKSDGEVLLFYKVGRKISEWYTNLRKSSDFGQSFSNSEELVRGDRGGRGPVRCKVITLSDGSMLAGTSVETGIWTAYADRSTDGGKTWYKSNSIQIPVEYHGECTAMGSGIKVSEQSFYGRGVIQPTLWETTGKVHMLLRSTEGKIYRADSEDYGMTWGAAYATELPNNNSGIDVVRCDDGLLVLCMNPIGVNWGARTPIILMISTDDGATWEKEMILEEIPGEYSYPAIIAAGDQLYVTYTYDRKTIKFWQLKRKENK
ncbi:MAG: exo-alpha-sialidase [Lachnospiraceae bacterium]|nr:exo-alpha-sialidase [Lachnospiraceae bacterium]